MIKPIVQLGHDALRTRCTPIVLEQIQNEATQVLIQDLLDTLNHETDGVGLSAPQIAVTKRIFVVSHKAFQVDKPNQPAEDLVFINPKITKASKKKESMEEGCLSIRWVYGQVERHKQVTLEYYDQHGNKQSRGFSGFVSHVVQHELDHLNGILFIDHAPELHELTPEEIAQIKKEHHGA